MTIDNIQQLTEEFVKRLQLPEAKYSFSISNSSEFVELIIYIEDTVKASLSISNGTLKVLYSDDYNSDKYVVLKFLTPISLMYYLCIFFFVATQDVSTLTFNDLLQIVLLDDISDWKSLAYALAENLNMSCSTTDEVVDIEGTEIRYIPYLHKIVLSDIEIPLEDGNYTTIVEGIFKSVEYIANIMGVADDFLFIEAEQDNVQEGEVTEEEPGMPAGGGGDMDIDVDVDMDEQGGEEPAAVEPMENETFEEPQGPVVTMDDLVE